MYMVQTTMLFKSFRCIFKLKGEAFNFGLIKNSMSVYNTLMILSFCSSKMTLRQYYRLILCLIGFNAHGEQGYYEL